MSYTLNIYNSIQNKINTEASGKENIGRYSSKYKVLFYPNHDHLNHGMCLKTDLSLQETVLTTQMISINMNICVKCTR